ncbi:hypothetical protein [Amycolatopsis sp. NPDC059657]|uniref:hypothetical protein n=1 Tax=Amycolatopsis sp. NPDC059657 TaxID=3346899 RepID=UPI0036713D34
MHYDREIVGDGLWQAQRDRIIEAGPETTLWESESEWTSAKERTDPIRAARVRNA